MWKRGFSYFSQFHSKKSSVDHIFYLVTTADCRIATNQWPFLSLFYVVLLSLPVPCVCNIDLVQEEEGDQQGFFEYTSDPVITSQPNVESESEIQAAAVSLSLFFLSLAHTHTNTRTNTHTHTHTHVYVCILSHWG